MTTIKEALEYEVAAWKQIGHFDLIKAFVLKHGKPMTLAKHQPRLLGIKQCFRNAANLAVRTEHTYVEGYAMSRRLVFPFHHAWTIDEAGNILDPTLRGPRDYDYYGVEFTTKLLVSELLRTGVYGLLDIGIVNIHLLRRLDPDLVEEALRHGLEEGNRDAEAAQAALRG